MPLFKVWSTDKLVKKLIAAENLKALISSAVQKLGYSLNFNYTLTLEDGTEVDDNEALLEVSSQGGIKDVTFFLKKEELPLPELPSGTDLDNSSHKLGIESFNPQEKCEDKFTDNLLTETDLPAESLNDLATDSVESPATAEESTPLKSSSNTDMKNTIKTCKEKNCLPSRKRKLPENTVTKSKEGSAELPNNPVAYPETKHGKIHLHQSNGKTELECPDPDFLSYEIPWHLFPAELRGACERKEIPNLKWRREMVRILVEDVQSVSKHPVPKFFFYLASKVVNLYPLSFKDSPKSGNINSSCASLSKQLLNRFHNSAFARRSNRCTKGIAAAVSDDDLDPEDFITRPRGYGCIAWQPKKLPRGEDLASQTQKCKYLQAQAKLSEELRNQPIIMESFRLTYYTQRLDINNNDALLDELLLKWPILFEPKFLFVHFHTLVGIDIKKAWLTTLFKKSEALVQLMKKQEGKSKEFISVLECFSNSFSLSSKKKNVLVLAVFPLLFAYFKEDSSQLYRQYKEGLCIEDVMNMKDLPESPFLAIIGPDFYFEDNKCFLLIENKVVSKLSVSVLEGVMMVFASYYCFNYLYPKGCHKTLEFLQRVLTNLNPDDRKISPTVRRLTNEIEKLENEGQGLQEFDAESVKKESWEMKSECSSSTPWENITKAEEFDEYDDVDDSHQTCNDWSNDTNRSSIVINRKYLNINFGVLEETSNDYHLNELKTSVDAPEKEEDSSEQLLPAFSLSENIYEEDISTFAKNYAYIETKTATGICNITEHELSPATEDLILLEGLRLDLVAKSTLPENERNQRALIKSMYATFAYQRNFICCNGNIENIYSAWPLLFEAAFVFQHFNNLFEVNLQENVHKVLKECAPLLFDHFIAVKNRTRGGVKDLFSDYDAALLSTGKDFGQAWVDKAKKIAMFPILLSYFKEDSSSFYTIFSDPNDIKDPKFPRGPCLVIIGPNLYHPENKCFVVINGYIPSKEVNNVLEGFMMVFALYSCFNLAYEPGCKNTLEFIQRLLVKADFKFELLPAKLTKSPSFTITFLEKVLSSNQKKTEI